MFFKMLEYVPKKWQNMPLSRNCILNDSLIDFYCNYDWITISTTVAERPVTCPENAFTINYFAIRYAH